VNQGFVGWSAAPIRTPYIKIIDRKAAGTDGGAFTSGADRTRDLNRIDVDTAGIATLASNQFTIPAGTYEYTIRAPAHSVGRNSAWLYNITDAVEVDRGQNFFASTTGNAGAAAIITGQMVLQGTKTFEVRHRCETTNGTNGFGVSINSGFTVPFEYYTTVELHKVG
jgi:hypothetical protein